MKKTFIAAVAALSLTGMTVAIAGPQSLQDPAAGSVRIVKNGSHYQPGASEFGEYASTYRLDNGKAVRFSQSGNHYYVEVSGERRARLFPTAAGKFSTAQGADFSFSNNGDTVAINNFHRLPMSVAMLPVEGTLVARR